MADDGDDGGATNQAQKLFEMEREDRRRYLLKVFQHFDRDKEGSIDNKELSSVLLWLGVPVAGSVLSSILVSMDEDKSGTIDADEFVMFFDRLRTFTDLKSVLAKNTAIAKAKGRIVHMYLVATLVVLAIVVVTFMKDGSNLSAERMVILMIVASLFIVSFCGIVIYPMLNVLVRAWVHSPVPQQWVDAKKRRARDVVQSNVVEVEEGFPEDNMEEEIQFKSYRRSKNPDLEAHESNFFETQIPHAVEDTYTRQANKAAAAKLAGEAPEEEDEADKPYSYGNVPQGGYGNTTLQFNPWSSTRAAVY